MAYSEHEWVWEELLTREPLEDEFLVEMIATGVCHTDISGNGGIYPRVLGHEGAGRVIRLGSQEQRKQYREDDLVILSAAACLDYHYYKTRHPAHCINHTAVTLHANEFNFVLARDPSQVIGGDYFGQSSFASHAPVKDAAELKMYAPLGCGIMTGSITHVAMRAGRCPCRGCPGWCGLGGRPRGKEPRRQDHYCCDLIDSRIELAKSLGATHSLKSSPDSLHAAGVGMATALRSVTPDALDYSHILDTSPSVYILGQCLGALQKNGMVLQVGVKPVGAKLELDVLTHMVNGRRLVGVIEGDRDPAEALPGLVSWVKDGTLPVDKMLKHFPVGEFVAARAEMESGEVIKSALVWD